MKTIAFAALTVLTVTVAQAGNLIQNSSFEQNADGLVNPMSGFTTLGAGSTYLTGWTVIGNGVDYINNYWQASDGNWSLDLSGSGPGGVKQTIKGLAAGVYHLSVDLSGNPDGGPPTKQMLASWGTGSEEFSFATGNNTKQNMQWHTSGTMFEWAGGDLTLSFATDTTNFTDQNTAYGPALDNVVLTKDASAAPAPPASTMMVLGAAGIFLRRRGLKRRQST